MIPELWKRCVGASRYLHMFPSKRRCGWPLGPIKKPTGLVFMQPTKLFVSLFCTFMMLRNTMNLIELDLGLLCVDLLYRGLTASCREFSKSSPVLIKLSFHWTWLIQNYDFSYVYTLSWGSVLYNPLSPSPCKMWKCVMWQQAKMIATFWLKMKHFCPLPTTSNRSPSSE